MVNSDKNGERSKRWYRVLFLLIGFGVLLVIGTIWVLRSTAGWYWEKTLLGPYAAVDYDNKLTQSPVSELSLDKDRRLAVYEPRPAEAPVIALISAVGSRYWAKVLSLQETNSSGVPQRLWVKQVRLSSVKKVSSGYKVKILCEWQRGGKEQGLILLNQDGSFKSVWLSW